MMEAATVDVDARPDVAVEMRCQVTGGELKPIYLPRWRAVLGRLEGRTVLVRIIRRKQRSEAANRYLWGVV